MFCDTEKGCANQLPNVLTTALHLYYRNFDILIEGLAPFLTCFSAL